VTGDGGFEIRPARPEETGAVAAVLAGAFEHDPVWGDWAFAEMLEQVLGPRAALVAAGFGLLGAERPHGVPHHYLSLLATDPGRRGGGVGMRLLAGTLDAVDAAGLPAYLESTNPANVDRYRSVGFERYGSFELPEGPTVTTMWRPARTGDA
jgi:GNAT superfamily N-acetyltransferase